MKIKAADFVVSTEQIRNSVKSLQDQVGKLNKYIGPLLKGSQADKDKAQEVINELNLLNTTVNEAVDQLSTMPASKWQYTITLLGKLGNLADAFMGIYDSAIPEGKMKSVYRNMVSPVIDGIISKSSDTLNLVKEAFEASPHEEQTQKEEPKETGAPKEEKVEEVKEESPVFTKQQLSSIEKQTRLSMKHVLKVLDTFLDNELADLPNRESYAAAWKPAQKIREQSLDLYNSVDNLHKKAPEEIETFAKSADSLVQQVQGILEEFKKTIPGADTKPAVVKKYGKYLIKAKDLLEDVYELLTFGRTFKRAYKTATAIKATEEDLKNVLDAIENLNIIHFDDQTDVHVPLSYLVIAEDQLGNAAVGIYPETAFDPNVVDDLIEAVEEVNPEAKVEAPLIRTVETKVLL